MELFIKKSAPKPSEVYITYWKFAAERQNIFFNRLNDNLIWTNDEILKKHKFTNAYRASDRVSQFLIKEVIYNGAHDSTDMLFRILIFKTFNKIETWNFLKQEMGEISYSNYDFNTYDRILTNLMSKGLSIYSGAYIMTSGKSKFGYLKKHRNHLKLIEYMINDGITEKVNKIKNLESLFKLLKEYPTIGNFLAYQYSIDINYSNLVDFDEMEFVFPGPGALDGIKKCFIDLGGFNESDIIKWVAGNQQNEFEKNEINFKNLWGRNLQLIDCQNLFCEVDKYARVAFPNVKGVSGRSRIKQKFTPKNEQIEYWYPPKWDINKYISL